MTVKTQGVPGEFGCGGGGGGAEIIGFKEVKQNWSACCLTEKKSRDSQAHLAACYSDNV